MAEKNITPAQAAKEFAALNNIVIRPIGRRYALFGPNGEHIDEVGGYPAALNAMRAFVEAMKTSDPAPVDVEMCAGSTLVLPEPSADPALNAAANNGFGKSWGYLEPITPDAVPMSRAEIMAPVKAEYERLKELSIAQSNATYGKLATSEPMAWAHKTADEIKADIVAGVQILTQQSRDYNDLEYGTGEALNAVAKRMGRDERAAGMSDREYRNLLIYGDVRGMAGVDYPFDVPVATGAGIDRIIEARAAFDDFDAVSQERIRKAAARLTRERRRASGKPPGGPWHVIYNGQNVTRPGYPSRADALAVVRWGFNHPEARIRNNWRTAAVTVEYRAQ